MIVLSPTGAFVKQLPSEDTDRTSVTYTISNQPPPPIVASFIVNAPLGILNKNPMVEVKERNAYGQLIFTVVSGGKTITGSNKKAFEPGEALEFETNVNTIDENVPVNKMEIQHNNNILDLSGLGLTAEEVLTLKIKSTERLEEVKGNVSALQSEIKNTNVLIIETRKAMNEANKAIKAVVTIYGAVTEDAEGNEIYQKLLDKLASLEDTEANLIAELNSLNVEYKAAQDDLLRLSTVVK